MARVVLVTDIQAPPGRCFDLSRDLDLHRTAMSHTGEEAIAGKTSGLIGRDEEVTWRARHFGVVHTHTSRITAFDPPLHFRDEMTSGRFKSFCHDHYFEPTDTGTRMTDVLDFASPFGLLGRLADTLFLAAYLKRLLQRRNVLIKETAEAASGSPGA